MAPEKGGMHMEMKREDSLKLDNQLCFPLYACARKIVNLYTPFLDAIGLTYTQYIAMMVLWEDKRVSVKTLGNRLYLDSGTLTPLLKRMEAQGWVTRGRDPEDERSVIVTLTEKGEALKAEAMQIPEKIMACVPLEGEEAFALYGLLHKLLDKL